MNDAASARWQDAEHRCWNTIVASEQPFLELAGFLQIYRQQSEWEPAEVIEFQTRMVRRVLAELQ